MTFLLILVSLGSRGQEGQMMDRDTSFCLCRKSVRDGIFCFLRCIVSLSCLTVSDKFNLKKKHKAIIDQSLKRWNELSLNQLPHNDAKTFKLHNNHLNICIQFEFSVRKICSFNSRQITKATY